MIYSVAVTIETLYLCLYISFKANVLILKCKALKLECVSKNTIHSLVMSPFPCDFIKMEIDYVIKLVTMFLA